MKITRRRLISYAAAMIGGAVGAPAAGWAYVTRFEPRWPSLNRVTFPLVGLSKRLSGFTIAQLSDLHAGPDVPKQVIARAVRRALAAAPDLLVITGDFVTGSARYVDVCVDALAPAIRSCPVLACLGNHDHWTDAAAIASALQDGGVRVLRNAAAQVAAGLWVAAVDDVWVGAADLDAALASVPGGALTLLLAHEPDYIEQVAPSGRIALQLSGHSHGGQVRVPLVGPPRLPYLAQTYHSGRYQVEGTWLYVSTGVGLIAPAVRFGCRSEVSLLTLQPATGAG